MEVSAVEGDMVCPEIEAAADVDIGQGCAARHTSSIDDRSLEALSSVRSRLESKLEIAAAYAER